MQAHPPPVIRWLHNGDEISEANHTRFQLTYSQTGICTLVIRDTQMSDAGQYVCHASNPIGKRQTTTFVVVEGTLKWDTVAGRHDPVSPLGTFGFK